VGWPLRVWIFGLATEAVQRRRCPKIGPPHYVIDIVVEKKELDRKDSFELVHGETVHQPTSHALDYAHLERTQRWVANVGAVHHIAISLRRERHVAVVVERVKSRCDGEVRRALNELAEFRPQNVVTYPPTDKTAQAASR
jgi:hypothetical protein